VAPGTDAATKFRIVRRISRTFGSAASMYSSTLAKIWRVVMVNQGRVGRAEPSNEKVNAVAEGDPC
jgi:hypothetical protein